MREPSLSLSVGGRWVSDVVVGLVTSSGRTANNSRCAIPFQTCFGNTTAMIRARVVWGNTVDTMVCSKSLRPPHGTWCCSDRLFVGLVKCLTIWCNQQPSLPDELDHYQKKCLICDVPRLSKTISSAHLFITPIIPMRRLVAPYRNTRAMYIWIIFRWWNYKIKV